MPCIINTSMRPPLSAPDNNYAVYATDTVPSKNITNDSSHYSWMLTPYQKIGKSPITSKDWTNAWPSDLTSRPSTPCPSEMPCTKLKSPSAPMYSSPVADPTTTMALVPLSPAPSAPPKEPTWPITAADRAAASNLAALNHRLRHRPPAAPEELELPKLQKNDASTADRRDTVSPNVPAQKREALAERGTERPTHYQEEYPDTTPTRSFGFKFQYYFIIVCAAIAQFCYTVARYVWEGIKFLAPLVQFLWKASITVGYNLLWFTFWATQVCLFYFVAVPILAYYIKRSQVPENCVQNQAEIEANQAISARLLDAVAAYSQYFVRYFLAANEQQQLAQAGAFQRPF